MKPQKDYLSVGEVARSLGWSTRFVEGLVRGEKLPCLLINGEHRFRREEIIDWLDQKIQTLDATRLNEFERKLRQDINQEAIFSSAKAEPIHQALRPEAVALDVEIGEKTTVLRKLVDLDTATGNVLDPERLYASLVEREYLCSTAFPGGFAICHPRRPIPTAIIEHTICLLRLKEPILFGAEDGSKTGLFFLLSAPNDKLHLHGLARLARILRSDLLETLRSSESVQDILACIRAAESDTTGG